MIWYNDFIIIGYVLTLMKIKTAVLWDVTQYNFVHTPLYKTIKSHVVEVLNHCCFSIHIETDSDC
jgi:hypothetical protein